MDCYHIYPLFQTSPFFTRTLEGSIMKSKYTVLSPGDLHKINTAKQALALDVLIGLGEHPKMLPSKYFYDERGSQLFQKIMKLEEYYLTKCEFQILSRYQSQIADLLSGEPFKLIELGAGDGLKTKILIEHFLHRGQPFTYIPIDISEAAMKNLVDSFQKTYSSLKINGLVAEYFDGLKWLSQMKGGRNVVLFLGSNLGNFHKPQARAFLKSLWNTLEDGDFLIIGFDLKKDIDLMLHAYNDKSGVTAEFNLNLLRRINRELQADFETNNFRFFSTYNVFSGAIESYLVSLEAQVVHVNELGQSFSFLPWEPIHTEYSYKYLDTDIEQLARATGFRIVDQFYDENRYFVDSVWKVEKHSK